MNEENPADLQKQPGFDVPEPVSPTKLVEPELVSAPASDPAELQLPSTLEKPSRPKPLPRFRDALPGSGSAAAAHSASGSGAGGQGNAPSKNASQPKSGPAKMRNLIVFTVALFVVALMGMVANIAFPIVADVFFPAKWVTEFRTAKASAGRDWKSANAAMLNALAEGKRENAPIWQQLNYRIEYGRAFMERDDYTGAERIFQEVAGSENSIVPDRQALALVLQGECEHWMFLRGERTKPDLTAEEKGLQLAQTVALNTNRQAYAYMMLGNLNGDLGNAGTASTDFDKAESIWASNPKRVRQVEQARWVEKTQSIIKELSSKSHTDFAQVVSIKGDEAKSAGTNALKLLTSKKFGELEKLFIDARLNRKRLSGGTEIIDSLYDSVVAVPDDAAETAWLQKLDLLKEWCTASPNSPTPHIALAVFYNDYAWKARGGGWANSVKQDQWVDYTKRLNSAAAQLEEAIKLGPLTPEWFSAAQTNFLGGGEAGERHLYEKLVTVGVTNFPDYMPIYLNRTYYLQPRWFGKSDEWVKYVAKEADKLSGTEGDKFYARMVSYVKDMYKDIYAEVPAVSRERVKRGNDALKKEFPAHDVDE
jgi:hypothetical protein